MKKKKNRPIGLQYNTSGLPKKRPSNLVYKDYKITYTKCFLCEKKKNIKRCTLLKWNRSFFTICDGCNRRFRLAPKTIKPLNFKKDE